MAGYFHSSLPAPMPDMKTLIVPLFIVCLAFASCHQRVETSSPALPDPPQSLSVDEKSHPENFLTLRGYSILGTAQVTIVNNSKATNFTNIRLRIYYLNRENAAVDSMNYTVYNRIAAGDSAHLKIKAGSRRGASHIRLAVKGAASY